MTHSTAPLAVRGVIHAPGDKSISHRALIFAAMAEGPSRIRGILESADVHATAAALRALGVEIPALSPDFVVHGKGVASLHSPASALDCANSGTTTRLLAGLVSGLPGRSARFEGDASLSRRPMRRIATPLMQMGAHIEFEGVAGHDGLPMRVSGAPLQPITYANEHASAQVKGALLLAGLASGVAVQVHEARASRDHSERMLRARGVDITGTPDGVSLTAGQTVQPMETLVPSDPSSATFFAALAAMADGGEIRLEHVCLNPTRTGAFDVLRRMGVPIETLDERLVGGEQIGTIIVRPGVLRGTTIGGDEIPRCIDELPMLACVGARADGETRITDARELRVKESDRIHAVVDNLRRLGVEVEEFEDGLRVVGSRRPLSGQVHTHGDHRLAMAFGILGALPGNRISIDDPGCVSVSYPSFWRDLTTVVGPAPATATASERSAGDPSRPIAHAVARRLVIAIDGPAASGKSSTAQWVAQQLEVRHVDSGALYRALTWLALGTETVPEQWTAQSLLAPADRVTWRLTERSVLPLVDGLVQDEAFRGAAVTAQVSRVAQVPEVRQWVNAQVQAAAELSDVVVDGRDIGTAVFPQAPLKVFLVADPWERARRRLVQRHGRRPTDGEIAEETEALVARDAKDASQSVAARDAITIDTTTVTQQEQVERIVALARATIDRLRSR